MDDRVCTSEEAALAATLLDIKTCDETKDYKQRNELILIALIAAGALDYKAGIRFDPKEPEWPVAFIHLPTGQVSWHLPQFPDEWDGHTTEQKYERVAQFAKIHEPLFSTESPA